MNVMFGARRWIVATVGAIGIGLGTASSAQESSALVARAQTAYFSDNASELAQTAAAAAPWAVSQNPRELATYAFVQFRLLQRAMQTGRKAEAERAGKACVTALDTLIKLGPPRAEAHALQSACYGYLANLGGLGAIRNGSRSGKSIEAALAIEPRNPRVLLVDGFGVYFRPKFVGGDTGKGCARFREAAAAFAAAGSAGLPSTLGIDWGAPDAHYWAGRCARDAGDTAGAQREFERALALRSDFAAARRALGR